MIASILLAAVLLITSSPQRERPGAPPDQQRSSEAQTRQEAPRPAERAPEKDKPVPPEQPPVVTKHEINAGGRTLKYTVTTGLMPIRNPQGETEANIFFMAYTLNGGSNVAERPLMFSFNGGP
ncbi:MAG TPA: peptidase S10, partial [Blastocatellia bacterium]|nr:peptidase S10 [Blastocatellia bacterium]